MVSLYQPLEYILFSSLLFIYLPSNNAQQDVNTTRPEVTISQGTLLGITMTTRNNRTFSAFLGIPFAQPPVGNLRFANPVEPDSWNGTRDASVDGSICPQITSNLIVGDEDCLYVNVYSPETTPSTLIPVMVYIHGGAFTAGSGSSSQVGPEFLLDADVVLVGVNYRLGILGLMSTGDKIASGNWGLKDQVLALKWVQNNVHNFGGDPDQVTIFGESAGAVSVHLLTLSNTTNGLFHKYIMQSGSALASWAFEDRTSHAGRAFELGESVGCNNDTSDSLVSCLRTVNLTNFLSSSITWSPTDEPADLEDAFITDTPTNIIAAGNIRDLPCIAGITRDEGLMFSVGYYENETSLNLFVENFDTSIPLLMEWTNQLDSGAAWTAAVKSYYFNDDLTTLNSTQIVENITNLISDYYFGYPARAALEQHHAVASNPQYFYTFDYRGSLSHTFLVTGTTTNYGVMHADDLIYQFPTEVKFSGFNVTLSETDYKMVDEFVQLWTSFAINGTPTASGLSDTTGWESYSSEDAYLRIGNEFETVLEVQYSFLPERMQFWANLSSANGTSAEDSGGVNLSANLFYLFVVVCLKFIL